MMAHVRGGSGAFTVSPLFLLLLSLALHAPASQVQAVLRDGDEEETARALDAESDLLVAREGEERRAADQQDHAAQQAEIGAMGNVGAAAQSPGDPGRRVAHGNLAGRGPARRRQQHGRMGAGPKIGDSAASGGKMVFGMESLGKLGGGAAPENTGPETWAKWTNFALLAMVIGTQLGFAASLALKSHVLRHMGPLYGTCLVLRNLLSLLALYGCVYGLLVEGAGASLLPFTVSSGVTLAWRAVAPFFVECCGADRATVLQHMLPVLSLCAVGTVWYTTDTSPHELLPACFYESNEFRLFGRNFTVHKVIDEGDHVAEESAILEAVEQLVGGAAVGVAYGLLAVGFLPTLLQLAGYLRSAYPPDPVPGAEYEDTEALTPRGSPRRGASQTNGVTAVCSILGARTAALFCDALGEELFFRSVAYRWCAGLIHGLAEDEAHATFELLPTLAVAAAFSTKFLGYKGELLLGLGLGCLLQAELFFFGSVLPCVLTHGFVLLVRDAFRAARPVPKPSFRDDDDTTGSTVTSNPQQEQLHLT